MVFCTKRLLKSPSPMRIQQSKDVPTFPESRELGLSVLQCDTAVLQLCGMYQVHPGQELAWQPGEGSSRCIIPFCRLRSGERQPGAAGAERPLGAAAETPRER